MDTRILALPGRRARKGEEGIALSALRDGHWQETSHRELTRRCDSARALLAEKEIAGAQVALLSESRPEWAVAFLAAIQAGATVVPLDAKLTLAERAAILDDCRPRLLLVSSRYAAEGAALQARLPFLAEILVVDDLGSLPAEEPPDIVERPSNDVALIVYTSGTTGRPKGVMVTLANLEFEVTQLAEAMRLGPASVFVSILPLNHMLEITCGLLAVLHAGGEVAYPGSLLPQDILRAMVERRATHVIAVPLFLKMLRTEMEKKVAGASRARRAAFRALSLAAARVPGLGLRRRLFPSVHRALGGALRGFISGGAPLDPALERFFRTLGIEVFQGYGLTETSPVISANTPGACAPGSVGRPLRGVEVRIAEGGEIWTRGPHVMKGYYGLEAETAAVLDDEGWLRTGDLGSIDAAGYLHITGRLKNLIVLGSGLKVQPEEVEDALARSPMFLEACVVGRRAQEGLLAGTEEVCAVVVAAEAYAGGEAARREVRRCCSELAPFKRPTDVVVVTERLPRTCSLKVQRHRVAESLGEMARLCRVS